MQIKGITPLISTMVQPIVALYFFTCLINSSCYSIVNSEVIATGNVSPGVKNAYFNPRDSCFNSNFVTSTLERRDCVSLSGNSLERDFHPFTSIICDSLIKEKASTTSELMDKSR